MLARENPFAVHRVLKVRYRLTGLTWEELMMRLEALRYRAAIVGEEGRGKTTLLEDLEPRLAAIGFRVLRAKLGAELPRVGPRDCVLFDGADLLSPVGWLRLRRTSRRAGGLLVTAHREGLLPTLVRCETTPALLAGIACHLAGEGAGVARIPPAEKLFARHGGNVRTALRELYDVFSSDSIVSEKRSTSSGIV